MLILKHMSLKSARRDGRAVVTSLVAKPAVYVVDDDVDVLGSLQFLLETDGFNVRTFRNGEALLKTVRSTGVDCFVIDYKMPDMNGIELARRLRNRDIAAPVILITGYPDENISARAEAAGVRHVMLKPLLEDSLITRIRGVIKENRASHSPGL